MASFCFRCRSDFLSIVVSVQSLLDNTEPPCDVLVGSHSGSVSLLSSLLRLLSFSATDSSGIEGAIVNPVFVSGSVFDAAPVESVCILSTKFESPGVLFFAFHMTIR